MDSVQTLTNPIFAPAMRPIQAITRAYPAVVTTTIDHGYPSGQWLRLVIPRGNGMQQANGLQGIIRVLSADTFSINIDTTGFDPFIYPPQGATWAQAIPFGEIASTFLGSVQNILPPVT